MKYVWEKSKEVFGDIDVNKRFLGALQTLCFRESKHPCVDAIGDKKSKDLIDVDTLSAASHTTERMTLLVTIGRPMDLLC